jgi:hypothetical protein
MAHALAFMQSSRAKFSSGYFHARETTPTAQLSHFENNVTV